MKHGQGPSKWNWSFPKEKSQKETQEGREGQISEGSGYQPVELWVPHSLSQRVRSGPFQGRTWPWNWGPVRPSSGTMSLPSSQSRLASAFQVEFPFSWSRSLHWRDKETRTPICLPPFLPPLFTFISHPSIDMLNTNHFFLGYRLERRLFSTSSSSVFWGYLLLPAILPQAGQYYLHLLLTSGWGSAELWLRVVVACVKSWVSPSGWAASSVWGL